MTAGHASAMLLVVSIGTACGNNWKTETIRCHPFQEVSRSMQYQNNFSNDNNMVNLVVMEFTNTLSGRLHLM